MLHSLTTKEYQLLLSFYKFDTSLSKNKLLEKSIGLNSNTTSVLLSRLLEKGYIEVDWIEQHRTALARVYKPSIPFSVFMCNEFGFTSIYKLIEKAIYLNEDEEQLQKLLDKITEKKNCKSVRKQINNSLNRSK